MPTGFMVSTRDGICRYDMQNLFPITQTALQTRLASDSTLRNAACSSDTAKGSVSTMGLLFAIFNSTFWLPSLPGDNNLPYSIYSSLIDKTGNAWFGTNQKASAGDKGIRPHSSQIKILPDQLFVRWLKTRKVYFGLQQRRWLVPLRWSDRLLTSPRKKLSAIRNFWREYIMICRIDGQNFALNTEQWRKSVDRNNRCGLWKYDGIHLTNYTTTEGLSGNSIRDIYKNKRRNFHCIQQQRHHEIRRQDFYGIGFSRRSSLKKKYWTHLFIIGNHLLIFTTKLMVLWHSIMTTPSPMIILPLSGTVENFLPFKSPVGSSADPTNAWDKVHQHTRNQW